MPRERFPDVKLLSLGARIAAALHLFRGYCDRCGLKHPDIDRFVEHLWQFIGLQDGDFKHWVENEPSLMYTGLGNALPPGFDKVLCAAQVPEAEFRQAITCTTEILYSSIYGAADEEGSQKFLLNLALVVERVGVVWPDMMLLRWLKVVRLSRLGKKNIAAAIGSVAGSAVETQVADAPGSPC